MTRVDMMILGFKCPTKDIETETCLDKGEVQKYLKAKSSKKVSVSLDVVCPLCDKTHLITLGRV